MKNMKWTNNNIPDLSGKTAIVTGANSGIGFETAKTLAGKNALVVMACRNIEKGNEAAEKIKTEFKDAKLEVLKLDLSSQKSIREFADNFKGKYNELHLLINNAGVMMPPYSKTEDGFELQIGTNHLGHFTLTGLLLELLLKTEKSRIVSVSSMAHKWGEIKFDDLNREQNYSKAEAYGQSKLANLLFTYELQRKLEKAGSSSIAVASHPGWTQTNLQRHTGSFRFLNPVFGQKPFQGAWPTLMAATFLETKGADYFGPRGFMEMKGHPKKVESNAKSHDKDVAAKLWKLSEELTGIKFEI
ncbi:oxidoreductase [Bacteroidota bacterium]